MPLIRRSPFVVWLALWLAACTGQPSASATSTLAASTTGALPTVSAAPPTAAPPTAVPESYPPLDLAPLITVVPPDAASAWTGISWRKLAPGDPLRLIQSVLPWRGGYVATGAPVPVGQAATTPVWISSDGASWRLLGPDVFGPTAIVLGVAETAGGVVALTLRGGPNGAMALPLTSWTSPDGSSWTAHDGPLLPVQPGCDDCGVPAPVFVSSASGLLVVTETGQMAISGDGVAWQAVDASGLPPGLEINPNGVIPFRSGFVAVAERNPTVGGIEAIALSTPDGRTWTSRPLPYRNFDPELGTTASRLNAGRDGLIARGSTGGAPGAAIWWSSLDGSSWKELADYPPLGTWRGEAEGSGISPDGTLVGDGHRLFAYRGEGTVAAWTSFDGRSWLRLKINGGNPAWGDPQHPELVLLPFGVLGFNREVFDRDGAAWFGEPSTT